MLTPKSPYRRVQQGCFTVQQRGSPCGAEICRDSGVAGEEMIIEE